MDFLKWLQSPDPVASVQRYFGVESLAQAAEQQDNQSMYTKASWDESSAVHRFKKEEVEDDDASMRRDNSSSHKQESSDGLFTRVFGQQMVGGDGGEQESSSPATYHIHNWFWFHLFTVASLTGDEVFYTLFFPFWVWNIDGAVIRRVILCWMFTMYIGQALKDLLQVPRPACPPVVRLDRKWVLEYGLPSTHAAVSLALPAAVLIFSAERYQVAWPTYIAIVVLWCLTVSVSRIYLGMHTLLDVVCGHLLAVALLLVLVPLMNVLDDAVLTHPISPLVVLGLTVAMVAAYPATATWNPARGDTAVILGVGCGTLIGAWLNYQVGVIAPPPAPPTDRYPVLWPSLSMAAWAVLRTLLGLVLLMLMRTLVRSVAMRGLCAIMQVDIEDYLQHNTSQKSVASQPPSSSSSSHQQPDKEDVPRKRLTRVQHCFIECGYKLITYISIGFLIVGLAPAVFRILGIERPTFCTEV